MLYIVVVFATPILASSLRVIRSLLEVREYKSHQIAATPFSIMISSDSIYVRHLLPGPLSPFGRASREGADPLRPHPCDDDGRLAVAVA